MQEETKMLGNGRAKKPARPKLRMTEKQKAARLANLEAGRKKKAELVKQKKMQQNEYDLSSSSSDSCDSESDASFIMKKVVKPKQNKIKERSLNRSDEANFGFDPKYDNLKNYVDEIKNSLVELANNQKKQNKATRKQTKRASGGTKIVVLPQNNPQTKTNSELAYLESLRKSLM